MTEAEHQKAPRRDAGSTRWVPTVVRFAKGVFGSIVALAGATAAISTALFIVIPQLEPREKLGAELTRVALSQNVDYVSYQSATSPTGDVPDVRETDPVKPGVMVWVHANISGYKDRSYVVHVTPYDAQTLEELRPSGPTTPNSSTTTATCDYKSPAAQEDGVVWRCWLVMPDAGTKYFVRAELFDRGPTSALKEGPITYSNMLDFRDTSSVTAVQERK